jgi:hypothetical protein
LKGERPHGGLMRFPLVALLLVIDLCPEGMSDRFGGPLHERLSQELGTLETPVHPGFLPAAFRHWRDAGIFLQCSGGRIPFALLPEGDQEAGRKDGSRAGQGLKQGEIGMTLGVLCNGLIKSLDRVQGHAQLTDEGLDEQGMGGDDALVSGQGSRSFNGVNALGEPISHPHMVVVKEGLQGGPPGQLDRFEGGPTAQKVTENGRIFVLKPLQHVGEIVLERTGEAMGDPHFIPDDAATVFDQLGEGPHGRTLRLQRLQLVAMGEEQFELEFGIGRVIFGAAGRQGLTIPRQCQRIDGKEDEKVIRAQGGNNGTFGEFEADGNQSTAEPYAPCGDPGRCARADSTPVWRCQQPEDKYHVWHPPSRSQQRPQMCRGTSVSYVISQSVLEWREGTCTLTCCEGIIGSRWRGRP